MTNPLTIEVSKDEPPRLHTLSSMAEVEPRLTEWIWEPYLPKGKLTILDGDPGLGKSVLTNVIAAALTRGWPLPGQCKTAVREPQRVLLLADEDDLWDTVRPRLDSLGAEVTLIRPVLGLLKSNEEVPLTLVSEGVEALRQEIEAYRPTLVVIDPLFSYLGGKVDINKGTEVRAMLRPLVQLCRETSATILGLRHLTKMNGGTPLYRGQGNIDFVGAARSVLAVREDPDNGGGRAILCHIKANLSEKGPSLAFRIGKGAGGIEFLWEGVVDLTVSDLFAASEEDHSAMDEARAFLADALFSGARPGKDVQREAREAGIAERTLWRAKSKLGVKAKKQKSGAWFWELPLKPMADMADMAGFQTPSQDTNSANSANSAKDTDDALDEGQPTPWWTDKDYEESF